MYQWKEKLGKIMSNKIIDDEKLRKEWDYEKNKNIEIESLTVGSHKKVWWILEVW